jgi:hypothetical protein
MGASPVTRNIHYAPDKIKHEAEESREAAKTFRDIMKIPEDAIPSTFLRPLTASPSSHRRSMVDSS